MNMILRFYREYIVRHWRKLLIALLFTATLNQAGFAFSMLGMWLVDDILRVGRSAPALVVVEPGESAMTEEFVEEDLFAQDVVREPADEELVAFEETPEEMERSRQRRGLFLFVAISIGLHLAAAVLGGVSGYLSESTGQRVLYRLRLNLKRRLTQLSPAYHSNQQIGQLMVRVLDDANAAQANTVNLPVNTITYLVTLGMGLTLLWRLNPGMTVVALCILPLYAMASLLFMRAIRTNTERIRTANADLQSVVEEDLTLMGTIKAYSREGAEVGRFFTQLRNNLLLAWRQNKLNTGLSVTLMIISGLGTTGILCYGFLQIRDGAMPIGAVLAFYSMTGLLFGPVTSLVNISVILQTTKVILSRVYDVLDATSDVKEVAEPVKLDPIRGEVSFHNVSLRYGLGPVAVRELTFHCKPGERIALLGSSGSGRTTVAHLLLRFYDPNEGTICLDGVDLRELPLAQLRSSIGMASQEERLFTGTIRDNIAFGAMGVLPEDEIERIATVVGIHEIIAALPDGYETRVGKGGQSLEHSLVQRIGIARVLAGNPALLFFDDSASTLADEEEVALYDAIRGVFAGRTQFIITNRVQTAQTMDRVLILRSGSLIESGTPEELLSARGTYWRMYLHQTSRPDTLPMERRRPDREAFLQ